MKLFQILLCLSFFATTAFSQSGIHGKVTDEETGEELIYANIVFSKDGVFVAGGSTDFEGDYSIPLDPGTYDMAISYTGYPDKTIIGISVKQGQQTKFDIALAEGIIICGGWEHYSYKIPLIDQDNTTSGHTISSEEIRNQSTKEVKELLFSAPGVSIKEW